MTTLDPFGNEPTLELRRSSVRAGLDGALARVDGSLPLSVPVLIGDGERTGTELASTDPGAPGRLVARDVQRTAHGGEDFVAGRHAPPLPVLTGRGPRWGARRLRREDAAAG